MLYNKNNVRKTNDKKILHKVGKQWKVISVALLMAIGGAGAATATHAAHADANNGVTAATSAEANSLEAMNNYANPYAKQSASSVAPKSVAKAPSFANISYAPSARVAGNNASAASYHNNDNFDKANMHYYGPIVNSYVNSINARFPEARSLANNYNNFSGKAANANSLANSYSATANAKSTSAEISARANAAHQTTSDYTDSVAYNVLNRYMPGVSDAAKAASQDSAVASGAALISEIDASPVLKNEYQDKAALLKASAAADRAYADDETSVAKTLGNDSKANIKSLYANRKTLNSLSLGADIAGINSQVDADFVNSVAASAGFSYNSSVVSSAISEMASQANSQAVSENTDYNKGTFNYKALPTSEAQFTTDTHHIVFSASNQANSQSSSDTIWLGSSDMNRVLSDTAAQQAYASSASSLENAIAKESAAVSSYNDQVSSANSVANSAKNLLSASESAYNSAEVLGNPNLNMDDLFSNPGKTQFTAGQLVTVFNNVEGLVPTSDTLAHALVTDVYNYANANKNASVNVSPDYINSKLNEINNNIDPLTNALSAAQKTYNNDINEAKAAHKELLQKNTDAENAYMAATSETERQAAGNAWNAIRTKLPAANKAEATPFTLPANQLSQYGANVNGLRRTALIDLLNVASSKVTPNADGSITLATPVDTKKLNSEAKQAVTELRDIANKAESQYTPEISKVTGAHNGLLDPASYTDATATEAAVVNSANNNASLSNSADYNSAIVSGMNSAANSAASNYNSASSASASYSNATDQNVTIASQFANYYGVQASSYDNQVATAKNSLDSYYSTHADNQAEYNNASAVYASASAAEPNDADLAHAFGINVLNHSPKYITVLKDAMLHSDTNYSSKNAVMSVKKGDQFAVQGVGFDVAGNIRYVVSTKNNKNYYLTANDSYVENTYLTPGVNYSFKLAKNAMEHANLDFTGKATPVAAGTVVKGVAVRADNYYEGITRLQLANGNYITTNDHYVSDLSVANNNSSNNSSSANYTPVQNHLVNF